MMNKPTKDPKDLLESILKNLGFEFTIEEKDRDGSKVLDIQAPDDSGRLIGRKGHPLFDLQYIINRILFQMDENAEKVMIDVAGYRFSEQDKLVEKALKSADQVRRWGDIVELDPMNSYDRRTIHNALKDDPDVETHSVEVDGTHDKAIILRAKK